MSFVVTTASAMSVAGREQIKPTTLFLWAKAERTISETWPRFTAFLVIARRHSEKPMPGEMLSFQAPVSLKLQLDEFAKARKLNRSAAIKAAILEATKSPDVPDVPDEGEVLVLLGEAARSGSVSAMKELRTYHRDRKQPEQASDPLEELDELAERRATRGA